MTFHFNDFEVPAALEDADVENDLLALTGCPIHKKINTSCTEPDCPNNPATDRLRARLLPAPVKNASAQAIFRTEAKVRCIL